MPDCDFRPLPGLGNPHVQTILSNVMPGLHRRLRGTRRLIPLEDGDRLVAHDDVPKTWTENDPWVLLVHGLGGSHASPYLERIASRLLEANIAVTRLDLRGAGAGLRYARKLYCAACTNDVMTVVAEFHSRSPKSPILVAGFSLGGNIILRWGGEFASSLPSTVIGLASVSAPVDMVRCADLIAEQRFYNRYYVRRLIGHVERHYELFPALPRVRFPAKAMLRDFDDLYTAPNWGFPSAQEYYRHASALPWIEKIPVPTFLLTAEDDPFVAAESLTGVSNLPRTEVCVTAQGGHLGFLGQDRFGGVRWFEAEVTHWLLKQVGQAEAPRNSRNSCPGELFGK